MDTKVLVVAIHGPYEPWMRILRMGQLPTWNKKSKSVKIINAFGIPLGKFMHRLEIGVYHRKWSKSPYLAYPLLFLDFLVKKGLQVNKWKPKVLETKSDEFGDIWTIQMKDLSLNQGLKNLTIFEHSLTHDYDFFVTVTTSTYLNVNTLSSYLENCPKSGFVGGNIVNTSGIYFQQGSFRVYSRDVVSNIAKRREFYAHWLLEDVAMSRLVSLAEYNLVNIPNLIVENEEEVLKVKHPEKIVSWRCKSHRAKERCDDELMRLIFDTLSRSEGI